MPSPPPFLMIPPPPPPTTTTKFSRLPRARRPRLLWPPSVMYAQLGLYRASQHRPHGAARKFAEGEESVRSTHTHAGGLHFFPTYRSPSRTTALQVLWADMVAIWPWPESCHPQHIRSRPPCCILSHSFRSCAPIPPVSRICSFADGISGPSTTPSSRICNSMRILTPPPPPCPCNREHLMPSGFCLY